MVKKEEFTIRPIGYIRQESEQESFIEILEPYRPALKELDKFSHVIIVWWAHEMGKEEYRKDMQLTVTPPYGENPPETGLFATRSQYRPNPVAITATGIDGVDLEKGIVKIPGSDAFPDTPVIDLKAYMPICDKVRDCHIAPWLKGWPECVEDGITWWEEQGFFDEE